MPLMWTDSMSVGVKEFDSDHQRLIRMIDQMHLVLRNADEKGEIPGEEIEITLSDLEKYFQGHCIREERAMARTGYPGLEEHREEHRKFIEKVSEMAFQYHGSTSAEHGQEIMRFMLEWLINHDFVIDKKYTVYLNSMGVF